MADARVDHLHAGIGQALGQFVLQVLGDLAGMAAQGQLAILMLVVRIAGGHRAQRRFGLDVHEALVVVHVVDRFGGIDHLPDDHRGDLDRAAVQLVDLQLAALEVAHALADPALGKEGVVPAQAVVLHRAHVLAEQAQYRRLVGLDGVQAGQDEHAQRHQQGAQQHQQQVGRAGSGLGCHAQYEQGCAGEGDEQGAGQRAEAVEGRQ
uniref:Uncharacterized protein n=1 Tax=Panagrolaimus superbus TaxID=310955 RepID=A0A914YKD6_9BILA